MIREIDSNTVAFEWNDKTHQFQTFQFFYFKSQAMEEDDEYYDDYDPYTNSSDAPVQECPE